MRKFLLFELGASYPDARFNALTQIQAKCRTPQWVGWIGKELVGNFASLCNLFSTSKLYSIEWLSARPRKSAIRHSIIELTEYWNNRA